jgi:hypothetical protein
MTMRKALLVIGLLAAAALTTAVPATATPAAQANPTEHHAPKGIPPFGRAGTSARTNSVPFPPTSFLYADAAQLATASGAFASITVEQPVVGPQDFHSNAEIAAESLDGKQIVEIGWIVDHNLNGDGLPHLFVFHWIDGVDTCYNGCGWVPLARAPFFAGQNLPVGATMQFKIQHVTTGTPGWQLSVNGIPIGEFPDTEWHGTFTHLDLAQWFGEVAASAAQPPCTEMGDGEFASSPTAARFSGIGLVNGPATNVSTLVTNPALYTVNQTAPDAFRFGGPGNPC